ncbi:endoribonuclease L-PSP [Pseudopedobacter saltans DSM 12145]|uniref:Endoribonuclease L-PSP n=1 Tax=Pseudopedobacter saltans (strain ATCC 51119 / DSM 12145 / JCM 21818 / CCUG 39354 / LMG 10337 / NBRC 100064 / NCIMB 13643) TaxID=762903 RepID=F0S7S8_PSESL|nr:Rid family detoxifying hydrolase [Pseudopedobacter saltans]ADY53333.1 endoribonuclease L-PSP [Pseudopedobacter saltans DSM 12145]
MKKVIYTSNAPEPIGPYSQAILINGTLYVSGQIAINPETNKVIDHNLEAETEQVLNNLAAVLEAADMNFSNVVKTSIFLSDMDHFAKVNELYGKRFTRDFPARETVAVRALPKNVNVEISLVAVK